jgi:hypothetical protein
VQAVAEKVAKGVEEVRTVKVHTSEGKVTVLQPWFMDYVRRHEDRVPYHLSEDGLQASGSIIYLDGTHGITCSEPALQGVLNAANLIAGSPWSVEVLRFAMFDQDDAKDVSTLLHAFGLADFWALPGVRMKCHELLIRHIDLLRPCFAADFGEDNSRQYEIFMVWMEFIQAEEFVRKGQMSTEVEKMLARCQKEMMQKEDKEQVGTRVSSRMLSCATAMVSCRPAMMSCRIAIVSCRTTFLSCMTNFHVGCAAVH